MKEFKGRAVVPGECVAQARVTHRKFDTYTALEGSLSGVGRTARCADRADSELFGKEIKGRALCLPTTTGSELGSLVLYCLCELERQPACLLLSGEIDITLCAGAVLASVWKRGVSMPVIDRLGEEFLDFLKDGMTVSVFADGTVKVEQM